MPREKTKIRRILPEGNTRPRFKYTRIKIRMIISQFNYVAGITLAQNEPRSFNVIPGPRNLIEDDREYEQGIRRFACPVGFFRLKRFCYYLSGGKAPWWEAHWHCKDRNATLSVLDRNGKDKLLRKYLMGEQFSKYK